MAEKMGYGVNGGGGKNEHCGNGEDGSELVMAMSTDNGAVEAATVKVVMMM